MKKRILWNFSIWDGEDAHMLCFTSNPELAYSDILLVSAGFDVERYHRYYEQNNIASQIK